MNFQHNILTNINKYGIMYLARKIAYNKKEEHLKLQVNVASINWDRHSI